MSYPMNLLSLAGIIPHVHHIKFTDIVHTSENIKHAVIDFRTIALKRSVKIKNSLANKYECRD